MPKISFLGIPLAPAPFPSFTQAVRQIASNNFPSTPIFSYSLISSTMSTNARRSTAAESSYRRIVSLPRNILGGISRAMDQGITLLGLGTRRNYNHHNSLHDSLNTPFQHMHLQPQLPEEYLFLDSFEQQFGITHPFFYACSYMDALKIAKDEGKFMFLYLHSPEHPFTQSFCRETLCSELVVQFLDANFVCWAALANRGEGYKLGSSLKATSFPFCALVAPASDDSIAVLQQLEGPVTPYELVEIMQKTLEEQGMAFGIGNFKKEEKRSADKRLKEEQNAAYIAALQFDQEKEKLRTSNSASNQEKVKQKPMQQSSKGKETAIVEKSGKKENAQITQILIRFPNGEREEHSFLSSDKIQAIFKYIDLMNLPRIENYKLVSNFPRKVYGKDQMGMSLKDAGLHPKATFFLELL